MVHGTSANPPKHVRSKLTVQAKRAIVWEAAKKLHNTLEEHETSTTQAGESVHRAVIKDMLHKSGLCRRMQEEMCCSCKEAQKSCLQFYRNWKRTWRKHVCSDETKIEHLGLNVKCCVWWETNINSLSLLWNMVASWCGKLVKVDGKMDGAKYRAILEGSLRGKTWYDLSHQISVKYFLKFVVETWLNGERFRLRLLSSFLTAVYKNFRFLWF